ncbi:MAG TPA: hypothetical protein VMV18_08465 [bacterium]|nr:hypothetical protein [bacterium]
MSALPSSAKPGALITEVVVQGVRRFGDPRRFTLGPGYNVLYGLSNAGKSTFFEIIRSLMFAGEATEAETFRSSLPQGQAACRAGITLVLGGETYRLLKDYQQGTVTLSRLTPERKFELMFADAVAIQAWLIGYARLTLGETFGRIFALSKKDLPSTTEIALGATARAPSVSPEFDEQLRSMSLADKRALLAKLADEYRRQAEVKTTEFLQDGLRQKIYEVDTFIKKRDDARRAVDEINIELGPIEKVPKLPDGFQDRLESYKRQEKTREAELGDLHSRQEDAHARLGSVIPPPFEEKDLRGIHSPMDMAMLLLKKDIQLDGGLAGVVAGIIFATFMSRPLNLLGVLALMAGVGVVVWRGLLVFLKGKEQFDGLRREVDHIDEQVKSIEKKWDIETTVIRNLMKAYKVDDPEDMAEIERKRDELLARRKDAEAHIGSITLPSGEKDLDAARAKYQKQIDQLDRRLQEISGNFTADPKDLEPQIERLDREVARSEGRKPTPRAKLFGREEDVAVAVEAEHNAPTFAGLVEAWCSLRNADSGRLLRSIQDAYGKNLRAISGGRFSEAAFDAEGSVNVREGQRVMPFETLDPMGKDAAYLALRITLFQLESRGSARVLVLLDDPFDYEEPRLAVISRALRALGHDVQVLHLTSRHQLTALADQTLEI